MTPVVSGNTLRINILHYYTWNKLAIILIYNEQRVHVDCLWFDKMAREYITR